MGNCLSGLAFKPEEDNDEPRYERIQPKSPRENIQKQTFSRTSREGFVILSDGDACGSFEKKFTGDKPRRENIQTQTSSRSIIQPDEEISAALTIDETMKVFATTMDGLADILGGIFEPRSETSNKQPQVTESLTEVRIRVSPVSSDKVPDAAATNEGIMNAMCELERELILRGESLHWPKLDKKDVETAEQEEKPSAQVRKKVFKRQFRNKNPKPKKRRISLKNFEVSGMEAPKCVDVERKMSFNQRLNLESLTKEAEKVAGSKKKRLPSFQIAKPCSKFKNIDLHKRNRIADIKNQNRCVRYKVKAD